MMRNLLLLSLLLTACELQPSPPKPPPAETATGSGSAGSGSAGSSDPTRVATPRTPTPVNATPECEQAGIKLADLMIAGADPSQKPAFEVDRSNIVRRTEIACTNQHWTPAALACIAQSNNDSQARACLEKFPSPTMVAPPAGAGSGSAAAPAAMGSGAGSGWATDPHRKDHPPAKGEHAAPRH